MSMASSIDTECSPPSPPSGASSPRCSTTTTVAATPCRASSPTGRPAGWERVHQTRPATATPGAASSPTSCEPWHGEPPRSYRPRPRGSGSGTGGMYSSPTGHTSPCRTRQRTGRATPSRRPKRRELASPWLGSLATGACHDLATAPYKGKGTGETTLLREMYDALKPGDVVLADALFDNHFLVCEDRKSTRL